MTSTVIHRIVERQAACCGDALALHDGWRSLTRRELNQRANAVARRLIAAGFRRGDLADVRMPASADLAVTLLAVLKTGGCYSWTPGRRVAEHPVLHVRGEHGDVALCVPALLDGAFESSPNLPVLVRGTDVACVLDAPGSPVLVPHATLVALQDAGIPQPARWAVDPGALALWVLLMTGTPAALADPPQRHAAA